MGTDRSDHPTRGRVPQFEWVFACNTVLGGVTPGIRDSRFNGSLLPYAPTTDLGSGARWCSPAWLERGLGVRGFLARTQSGLSRCVMTVRGQVTGGSVVVVPDDQLESVAALAARLMTSDGDERPAVREWSMAVVREPGRSRPAVRVVADGDALAVFAAELDVEWFVDFGPGCPSLNGTSTPDHCTVRRPDGSIVAELGGAVYLENEPIPTRLVDIAARFADGPGLVGRQSAAILVSTGSHRPLEPDEWDVDRDLQRWIR